MFSASTLPLLCSPLAGVEHASGRFFSKAGKRDEIDLIRGNHASRLDVRYPRDVVEGNTIYRGDISMCEFDRA
jgi:hypothetical protein